MITMTKVKLVNGEEVPAALESSSDLKLTFVRLDKELILGIVNNETRHGFFLFQENDECVYQPVGEGNFSRFRDLVHWTFSVYQRPELEPKLGPERNEFLRVHASGILSTTRESVLNASKQPLPV